MKGRKMKQKIDYWVAMGAVVLIILLLVWLTVADLWGDTDVSGLVTGGRALG